MNTQDLAKRPAQWLAVRLAGLLALSGAVAGCAGSAALQPDRSIFSLDNNYQRYGYGQSIEETFDRTVSVFKESGYKLDVIDRATGQISGTRGATGDKGAQSDKGLKFYALVLPRERSGSELALKVVQVLKSGGAVMGQPNAELIVTDPLMYRYAFRRIETKAARSELPAVMPEVGGSAPQGF